MSYTTDILCLYAVLMGVIKYIPQMKISYSSKSCLGLCYPFLFCDLGFFVLSGIFRIVNAGSTFETTIGSFLLSFGIVSPLITIGQKIFYERKERREKQVNKISGSINDNLISNERISSDGYTPKKGAPSTTIYSSDSIILD